MSDRKTFVESICKVLKNGPADIDAIVTEVNKSGTETNAAKVYFVLKFLLAKEYITGSRDGRKKFYSLVADKNVSELEIPRRGPKSKTDIAQPSA